MDAFEAILTRRSIRSYTDRPVSAELVSDLLSAAMSAPSAGNQQPWHFVVVTDRLQLQALTTVLPFGQMLAAAPLGIAVCADLNLDVHSGYWVQDCSAATQNLLLAAHAGGLGAVWIGVYPIEERVLGIRRLLHLPETVIPLCLVAAGYPAEHKPPAGRYNPARVHQNAWET